MGFLTRYKKSYVPKVKTPEDVTNHEKITDSREIKNGLN